MIEHCNLTTTTILLYFPSACQWYINSYFTSNTGFDALDTHVYTHTQLHIVYLSNESWYVGWVGGKAHSKHQSCWLPHKLGNHTLQVLVDVQGAYSNKVNMSDMIC